MTADVIQIRDWDWLRPVDGAVLDRPCTVTVLPVARVERHDIVPKPPRAARRTLLGDT